MRVLYPMRIPIANRLVFYGYMAALYMHAAITNDPDTPRPGRRLVQARNQAGQQVYRRQAGHRPRRLRRPVWSRPLELRQQSIMFQSLRLLPELGFFVIPLIAYHTMPLESSLYRSSLHE